MDDNTYRHELKYQINYVDYIAQRQRLKAVMKSDEHADAEGKYLIRSIYFDNFNDKALREKINGIQKREKWRIRYYNDDLSYITLEKKCKHNSLCLKLDALLTEAECRALLSGKTDWMLAHTSQLVREFYCKLKTQQLKPRVLVSYEREPYIYIPGNVRVTFDRNIRTSLYHQSFLEATVRDINATDTPGIIIMEVKYDDYLPEIISSLLQTEGIRQQAFSKYGVCRRYG